jgi:hypothetical protein
MLRSANLLNSAAARFLLLLCPVVMLALAYNKFEKDNLKTFRSAAGFPMLKYEHHCTGQSLKSFCMYSSAAEYLIRREISNSASLIQPRPQNTTQLAVTQLRRRACRTIFQMSIEACRRGASSRRFRQPACPAVGPTDAAANLY